MRLRGAFWSISSVRFDAMAIASLFRHLFGRPVAKPSTSESSGSTTAIEPGRVIDELEPLLAAGAVCAQRLAWSEAVAHFERACELAPESAQAHLALARAHLASGQRADAADSYRLALHYAPTDADAALELCGLLAEDGRFDAAIECLRALVDHQSRSAPLHAELGLRLIHAGRVPEARAVLDNAVYLDPDYPTGWHNRGYLRLLVGESDGALEDFQNAVRLKPKQVESIAGTAHALRDLGRFDEAIGRYRRILERHPRFEDARMNLALTQLLLGRLEEGFRGYEWRFGAPGNAPRGFPFPVWKGQPLAGKRILVYAEQGVGDEILFASCLPDVLRSAEHVTIECSSRLEPLFARSFATAKVQGGSKTDSLRWLDELPPMHYQTPIGSLPRYLRQQSTAFPRHTGYLRANQERVAYWRSRVARLPGRLRVGLSWRGGNLTSRSALRSVPWPAMERLLHVPGASFVCLQHGEAGETFGSPGNDARLHVFDRVTENIDDLAAVMLALDLVISVDNTNVHIAGGVGAPVWVLLASVPDWRYGIRGEEMSWYPSAKLYRQTEPGQWGSVLGAVEHDLVRRVGVSPRAD